MMITLRNTFLFTLAVACCTYFTGCSDDDEDRGFDEANLVGTWRLSSSDLDFTVSEMSLSQWFQTAGGYSVNDAQILAQDVEAALEDEFYTRGSIQFNSDKTYEATDDGDTDEGNWTLSSDARILTLNSDSDLPNQQITITRLDVSNLSFQFSEAEEFDLDNDGSMDDELRIAVTLRFTKL